MWMICAEGKGREEAAGVDEVARGIQNPKSDMYGNVSGYLWVVNKSTASLAVGRKYAGRSIFETFYNSLGP